MVSDLAIVTVADSRFLPAACCQLLSVAENLPSRAAAQLFLIVVNVNTDDTSRFANAISITIRSAECP